MSGLLRTGWPLVSAPCGHGIKIQVLGNGLGLRSVTASYSHMTAFGHLTCQVTTSKVSRKPARGLQITPIAFYPKELCQGVWDPRVSCHGIRDPKISCDGIWDPRISCYRIRDPGISCCRILTSQALMLWNMKSQYLILQNMKSQDLMLCNRRS